MFVPLLFQLCLSCQGCLDRCRGSLVKKLHLRQRGKFKGSLRQFLFSTHPRCHKPLQGRVGMLAARETPTREQHNGEGSDEGSESLPLTLEDFQTTQEAVKPAGPVIHEPPSSASTSVPAPQRFKKGNLRLLQVGVWKLFCAQLILSSFTEKDWI